MRLPASTAGLLLASLAEESAAARDLGTDEPVLGSWSATRWEYTGVSGRTADVICDLGGSVTLSLSPGTWILTWDIAGRGRHSSGGTYERRNELLELRRQGGDDVEHLVVRASASTLALSKSQSSWDFGAGTEEPASFVAVLVRL